MDELSGSTDALLAEDIGAEFPLLSDWRVAKKPLRTGHGVYNEVTGDTARERAFVS